jgi:hypothetical protein
MKRLLVQTQLSNVNYKHNKFDLACDSGWQMVMGRVREMLRRNSELDITVQCPYFEEEGELVNQVMEHPVDVYPGLWEKYGADGENRLHYAGMDIIHNALVTRFDFDWTNVAIDLDLGMHKVDPSRKYDAVYINDPMQLRNWKAMFYVVAGYQPRFYVHSHFVDVPEVPKFPQEASLWLGQCEAALKADYNFWQCESAMLQFFDSMGKWFTQDVVDDVRAKSLPWDDGYSTMEITDPIDEERMRFTREEWQKKTEGKVVLFFPNRISPSSGDYTNGMKFMFELLPQLRQRRQDFVVVCGNPNQKFTNAELEVKCGKDGYIKLTDDTFDRNEYKFVGRNADIAIGLYNVDAYGGTAARELVELGCVPLWLDNYEYSSLAEEAGISHLLAKPNFSDLVDKACEVIDACKKSQRHLRSHLTHDLIKVVRNRCSYELTTPKAMARMGLI